MSESAMRDIEKLERDLWEAADQLRANSKLTASEYCMPVLGIIFLRHAANRFDAATQEIEGDIAAGRMPKRKVVAADYMKRGALWLPEQARWRFIVSPPDRPHEDLGKVLVEAMEAIEESFEPLRGMLPKDYTIFERNVLDDLVRIFNREALNEVSGEVFGHINEYFLMQFSIQEAQDRGEFLTPPALVKLLVHIIEPEHGNVFDPANGACGMMVQTAYFIRSRGGEPARKVVFYGQEAKTINLRLGIMNLAVHGLTGNVREANTFYEDVHNLVGRCDFLLTNPPFNVDKVDAEKVKSDPRLPFGLPGVNKQKTVSNGNYLWISYFWSYLNDHGRAGFVMSSQASSAGNQEKEVRRKIVETGDVDVMVAIRSNFFYTRTVPCELWFFDRGKPADRKDKVLMLDARSIYRKVTRKIYDFSPEQLESLAVIVALYRWKTSEFLALVKRYLAQLCEESGAVGGKLQGFDSTLADLRARLELLT